MTGTFINAGAIIAGTFIGLGIRTRLPEKIVSIIFQGIGLITIAIGISMFLQSKNIIFIVISIVLGSITGQIINLERYFRSFSDYFQRKYSKKTGSPLFTEGFLTSTMLFCVGSMSILGAIEEGSGGSPHLLLTKSIMDGVSSVALASSFGICIAFSSIPVLIYQGGLTLFTSFFIHFMSDSMVSDITSVGGILLLGLGITILKIREIPITNMLPSIIIVVILSHYFS
jgi:uncharacterized membrane protein YqgA involved in biofilm formation